MFRSVRSCVGFQRRIGYNPGLLEAHRLMGTMSEGIWKDVSDGRGTQKVPEAKVETALTVLGISRGSVGGPPHSVQ